MSAAAFSIVEWLLRALLLGVAVLWVVVVYRIVSGRLGYAAIRAAFEAGRNDEG